MIYLKWLSKIKQWFKSEEIYEIEEIILNDDEQLDIQKLQKQGVKITTIHESRFYSNDKKETSYETEYGSQPAQEQYTHSNELDAKIHYQYPKGEFRFPLIPDNKISERRKKEQRNVSSKTDWPSVNLEKVVPRNKGNLKHSDNSDKKRPFRPSEIPSPVYGFQQRPKKTEHGAFAFEMDENNQPSSSIHVKKEIPKERNYPFVEETSADTDIPAFFRKRDQVFDFNNGSDKEEAFKEVNVTPVQEITPPESGEIHKSEDSSPNVIEEDVPSQREKQYANTSEDEQKSIVEKATEVKEVEKVAFIHETYEEAAVAKEMTLLKEEFDESEVQESPIHIEQAEAYSEEYATPTPIVAEERKRKHIPFNVVMLRQDKERLQKNQSKIVEKKTENVEVVSINEEMPAYKEDEQKESESLPYYRFPSIEVLSPSVQAVHDDDWLDKQGHILNETLFNFNVRASVVNITQGPAVTQFEIQPEPGVKVNKVTNLADDIKLCLAAQDVRIEAPIPGKHTIGIEIPNRKSRPVFLREILESDSFKENESPLTVALGLDITGKPIVTDLRKMPHGLIAGATGSGKSVCINSMLISLLYKATPQEVKMLLIDPKMVELAPYNHIPHLVSPVITDVKAATAALKWAVEEMERRYELFAHTGVRDIGRFNSKAKEAGQLANQLPYIVIVIDELADLMMMSPAEVEESICRIAQKARACGIHLVVATQRPSVDVITGLIKANIPTRIAFSVSSQVDSRTILDSVGADKLLGRGDMLFLENGSSKTVRLQGTFVTDEEIEDVVDFVRKEQEPHYLFQQEDLLAKAQVADERDELFLEACEFVVYQNAASTSSLQRRFHIGYNRAARLMEILESNGVISEARGSRPREVLMSKDEYDEWVQMQVD